MQNKHRDKLRKGILTKLEQYPEKKYHISRIYLKNEMILSIISPNIPYPNPLLKNEMIRCIISSNSLYPNPLLKNEMIRCIISSNSLYPNPNPNPIRCIISSNSLCHNPNSNPNLTLTLTLTLALYAYLVLALALGAHLVLALVRSRGTPGALAIYISCHIMPISLQHTLYLILLIVQLAEYWVGFGLFH